MRGYFALNKSIFGKLLNINLLIVGIVFLVISVLLFSFLGDYAVSEKEESLKYTGERVCELTSILIDNNDTYANKIYRMNLESYGDSLQALIMVTDNDGTIFAISNSYYNSLEGKKLDEKQYAEVVLGEKISRIGTFGNMFENTVLTVGLPLEYEGDIIGAVFLHTPTPEANRLRFEVFKLFLYCLIIAAMVSFLLILLLSKKISEPLKMISDTAKSFASGHFDKRVTISSNDEIGEVALAFNKMAKSLEELEDNRRMFIANVSHELRTPMTTITGFIEGIIDGTIPQETQKKYLGIVLDEAKRLSRLVTDLLTLAKMEARENKIEKKKFDINELTRLTIIKFENRITDKEIHIRALFEEEHCNVVADRDSIQRVLMNLLDNAIKFSEIGGEIDIAIKTDRDKVLTSIKNYGVSLSEEELYHIWDRFYKTDKSRSKDKSGTGLGLSIVKSIINYHDEKIWATSKSGEYTEFLFTLQKA